MQDKGFVFQPEQRKRRILAVGNASSGRRDLCAVLEKQYQVVSAMSGAEALSYLYEHGNKVSLVLLDLALLDISGLELIRRITQDSGLAAIPVAVFSTEREDESVSLNSGAMEFIPVPWPSEKALLARLHRIIELSEDRAILNSAERDQLTGLYNKDFFLSYARQYDEYYKDRAMDAVIVDINHLRLVNERFGRSYGDDVLRRIGQKIGEKAGGHSIASRGEGKFLVYCPHREDYDLILKDITACTEGSARLRMGVYSNVDKEVEVERRFDRAMAAVNSIRGNFQGGIAYYDDKMRELELYNEQILEDFPGAVEGNQFVVYYQPKFDIRTDTPVLSSAEALVRWVHPVLGLVAPDDFIPLLEESGLIYRMDSCVWRQVAEQMHDWKIRLGMTLPVSVNVSRGDLLDYDVVDQLVDLLEEFDLTTDEFLLEITESAYAQDYAQLLNTVNRLRDVGFKVEVDDFGSGYSSLNMLTTMKVDAIKLDMNFLHNAFKERQNTRMLDAVIDIACSLGVPTVAEGVETAEQMLALKAMGCDVLQGFYFSKPLPADEYEAFLLRHERGGAGLIFDQEKDRGGMSPDEFTYDALHDPETGVYNHSGYKVLLKDSDQNNIALLIADIDDFEEIRLMDGEEAATQAAIQVATSLKHNFRSVDFICRINVNEFAVIMTRVNSTMRKLVFDKVEQINEVLRTETSGERPVSLSVGVAFADRDNPQGDIFHDADIALNRMKEMKRSGCAIF